MSETIKLLPALIINTDIKVFFLTATSLVNVALGLLVYIKGRKRYTNIFFSAIVFSVALWAISMLFFQLSTGRALLFFWANLVYIFATFIASSWVLFNYAYPQNIFLISPAKLLMIVIPNIVVIIFIFWPNPLISDVIIKNNTPAPQINSIVHIIYSFYITIYFGWGLLMAARKYFRSSGIIKIHLRYLIVGATLSSFFGVITSLVLPAFDNFLTFSWAPVLSSFLILPMAYVVIRYKFLNVKVVAVELFVGIIVLVVFFEVLIFNTIEELLLRLAIFIFTLILGGLSIKSAMKEQKDKEHIESLVQKLETANQELKKLDEMKSEFVSIASHQLKTPLAVMKGYLSMMLEGGLGDFDQKQIEAIKKSYDSNERLITLVNNLLNLSRIESGRMEYNFESVKLEDVVESVTEELKPQAARKNIELAWSKPEDIPRVFIDQEKIRQAVLNLIDNAIKYTEKGTVEIKVGRRDNKIFLEVKDSGTGMTQEDIGKIFEKFSRANSAQKIHAQGMGLGLYIAHQVVEAHKGKVWAESEGLNKGSKFIIELPVIE